MSRKQSITAMSHLAPPNRLEMGNHGAFKALGDGVTAMKIDHGPGYRIYYTSMQTCIVSLLCGGDKTTQDQDIKRAKELVQTLRNDSG